MAMSRKLPRIGFVSEGDAEIFSLPKLFPQLEVLTGNRFVMPIRATIDPISPPAVIAKGVSDRVRLSVARGADRVVVLIDRESLPESASARATAIQTELNKICGSHAFVVIKDRMYENWLISCPTSFSSQKSRFPLWDKIARISAGCADNVANPIRLIGDVRGRGNYDKVQDAARLLKQADIENMARNSRSFRRFLALVGDPRYVKGSAKY